MPQALPPTGFSDFLLAAGGGALLGFVVFRVVAWFRPLISDPVLDTAVSFVIPFVAYLGAEAIHASGVLAVVVAGLLLGHKAPLLQTAKSRITERTNWRTIAFLLENLVFLLIGLQAQWIVGDVLRSAVPPGLVVAVCLATLGAVIVLRLAWVFPARYLLIRPGPDPVTGRTPPAANTFILGWAGMRGVVTLAAAFVIPPGTPYREVLLLAVGTGIGGALLLDGRLRHGSHGTAGEIAHLLAGRTGPIRCGCGRDDHVEAVCSGPAIHAGGADVGEAADVLGRALAGLVTALDVDAVIIGGGVAQSGAAFLEPFARALRAEVLPPLREIPVLPAELGLDAPIIGAALLAADLIAGGTA